MVCNICGKEEYREEHIECEKLETLMNIDSNLERIADTLERMANILGQEWKLKGK